MITFKTFLLEACTLIGALVLLIITLALIIDAIENIKKRFSRYEHTVKFRKGERIYTLNGIEFKLLKDVKCVRTEQPHIFEEEKFDNPND